MNSAEVGRYSAIWPGVRRMPAPIVLPTATATPKATPNSCSSGRTPGPRGAGRVAESPAFGVGSALSGIAGLLNLFSSEVRKDGKRNLQGVENECGCQGSDGRSTRSSRIRLSQAHPRGHGRRRLYPAEGGPDRPHRAGRGLAVPQADPQGHRDDDRLTHDEYVKNANGESGNDRAPRSAFQRGKRST